MNVRDELEKFLSELGFEIKLTQPPEENLGDYSTSIAFKLCKENPIEFAKELVNKIRLPKEIISKISVVNGFINFSLNSDFVSKFPLKIINNDNYGSKNLGNGNRVLVEFVSANPTGPLNIANGRSASVGDAIVRILNWTGFTADSEYYVNDCGRQVALLEKSIIERYKELHGEEVTFPPEYYPGEYIKEIAKNIKNLATVKFEGINHIVNWQKSTLEKLGVKFNNWVYESNIRETGLIEKVIKILNPYYKDGCYCLKLKNREKVLIKSDGEYTYLLPDIAYHLNKLSRGYDLMVDLLGADHLTHSEELKECLSLCGVENKLKIIIIQWVSLIRGGKKISMSKRHGEFITLDDIISEVGVDATRFFFLLRKTDAPLDFDIDLAKKQANENPVYYVQYAHARICSILRKYGNEIPTSPNLSLLSSSEELRVIRKLIHFPEVIEDIALNYAPHILPYYLIDLSTLFHNFYEKHRVISPDKELTKSRIVLVTAVKQVLSKGLSLIGVSAPEEM